MLEIVINIAIQGNSMEFSGRIWNSLTLKVLLVGLLFFGIEMNLGNVFFQPRIVLGIFSATVLA